MEELSALGFTMPTPAYLVGMLVFGLIGIAAYRYGKKTSQPKQKWIGVALMLYPYAVSQTWLLWGIGVGLTGWLFSRWK